MGAAIGIALVALLVIIVSLSLSPLFIVPVAIAAFVVVLRPIVASISRRSSHPDRKRPSTPSTREASYEPVSDPSER